MNRLWSRLALAFIGVIVLTLLIVAGIAANGVGNDFQQYLIRRDELAQNGVLDSLAAYYQQHGRWEGTEAF